MQKLLIDTTDTSHCHAHSGVQRVVRSLAEHLRSRRDCRPVLYDRFEARWRQPEGIENDLIYWNQSERRVRSGRGARWTPLQKARSLMRQKGWLPSSPEIPESDCFLTAEIFSPATRRAYPEIFRKVHGPKIAIFHDAIAVKFPEWYSPATVEGYQRYMTGLAGFDGILADSECSAADLREFWEGQGLREQPSVEILPLGADVPDSGIARVGDLPESSRPIALFVSTFETRKNHLELLKACSRLWEENCSFELRLVGGSQKRSGKPVEQEIQNLRNQGFPVRWEGPVSEQRLNECYEEASFVVYPSLYEGFGLPVIEAMKRGKPVVMTDCGSLRELVEGGGCLVSSGPDSESLAETIKQLISSPEKIRELQVQASSRHFPDWGETASFVVDFLQRVSPRPTVETYFK